MNKPEKSLFKKFCLRLIVSFLILGFGYVFQEYDLKMPLNAGMIAYADDNIASTSFTLDVNSLSPGAEKYSDGPKENITNILKKITRFLLIVIPTLAVLFIVVGAIKIMLAGGDSSKINNGKAIITYNIIAIVLALTSWSIVKLTIWIIGSST